MILTSAQVHAMAREMDLNDFEQGIKLLIKKGTATAITEGTVNFVVTITAVESKLSPSDFEKFEEVVSYFEPKFYKEKEWLDCYDKLIRIDKYTEEGILYIVRYFRKDENFWKKNFHTLLKLRKLTPDKIKYVDMFKETIKAEHAARKKGHATGNIIHKEDGKKRDY